MLSLTLALVSRINRKYVFGNAWPIIAIVFDMFLFWEILT